MKIHILDVLHVHVAKINDLIIKFTQWKGCRITIPTQNQDF